MACSHRASSRCCQPMSSRSPPSACACVTSARCPSGVAAVAMNLALLAVQQLAAVRHVGLVGCRADHAVDQARLGVHAGVQLHAECQCNGSILDLVHLGIALATLLFSSFRDDGAVQHRALAHEQPELGQVCFDLAQDGGRQVVLLYGETSSCVVASRRSASQVDTGELAQAWLSYSASCSASSSHGVYHCCRKYMRSARSRRSAGKTFAALGVVRLDQRLQSSPWLCVHLGKKPRAPGLFFFVVGAIGTGKACWLHSVIIVCRKQAWAQSR